MAIRTVLAFAVLTGAAAAWGADPRLMSLMPADAQVVAGVSVDRTITSPFGQYILRQMQEEDADFKNFVATTGFDPRRDVRELMFATNGQKGGKGIMAVRGMFVPSKLIAYAQSKGAKVINHSGFDVITNGEKSQNWFAILDTATAVGGDSELVKLALENVRSAPRLDAKLAAKVSDVSGQFDVWMVSNAPLSQFANHVPDKQVNGAINSTSFKSIEQTSGGILFGSDVKIAGEAVTQSPQDANALADVARFVSGLMAMNGQQAGPKNFAKILETLQITTEGSTTKFSVTVQEADLEKLLQKPQQAPKKPAKQAA